MELKQIPVLGTHCGVLLLYPTPPQGLTCRAIIVALLLTTVVKSHRSLKPVSPFRPLSEPLLMDVFRFFHTMPWKFYRLLYEIPRDQQFLQDPQTSPSGRRHINLHMMRHDKGERSTQLRKPIFECDKVEQAVLYLIFHVLYCLSNTGLQRGSGQSISHTHSHTKDNSPDQATMHLQEVTLIIISCQ